MTQHAFSVVAREGVWKALGEETFDLLVVGAGITGAGIAHDAAGRGLRVALVDAGDIAEGTSSRSSRLVHGGLRYLETFEFGLVFEALKERRVLLELAPHLVQPLAFLFPVFRGDPTGLMKLTAGMWLYDGLSLFRSPDRHKVLGKAAVLEEEPRLRSDRLVGGARYHDAQVDDARLTLSVARAAAGAGALVLTHARVVSAQPRVGGVGTAVLRDQLSDREVTVKAKLIINATGPWSDGFRRLTNARSEPRLRATKGVHILVPRERLANVNAIIFRSPVDGRVMFVLPWRRFAYVGTTDTEFSGDPGDARGDTADVDYLLKSANHIFPEARLGADDVVSIWAGIRPLLAPSRGVSASATSREHAIWRDQSGLLNVAGGKLTTFRSMAAEVATEAATILDREFRTRSGEFYTEFVSLPGAPETSVEALTAEVQPGATSLGIDSGTLASLVRRHGTDVKTLLNLIAAEPGLAAPIQAGMDYLLVEAVHAVRSELAVTLEDVLRRRLHVLYESKDGAAGEGAETVARRLAQEPSLQWGETDVSRELSRYRQAVEKTRVPT